MILKTPADQNVVSCRNLTFVRSINNGKWYNKLYNPPVAAQFLKEISFELNSGEVLGVVGSSGSGKSTLLKVVSHRLRGNIGGCLMLNGLVLSKEKFASFCEFVSFKRHFLPSAKVKTFLLQHADLVLTTKLNALEKEKRVLLLMQEFDLLPYSEEKIGSLSESARRRFIIALHLIRDPLLIVVDDIIRDLEALSGYQLMYALNNYVRRTNRLAMVSMRAPRSDIYQLLSRMTMLFYGEMVYSESSVLRRRCHCISTKSGSHVQYAKTLQCITVSIMSNHFLPKFVVSLATIDRETSERYLETQEQAHKLVHIYKVGGAYISSVFNFQGHKLTESADDSTPNDGYLFPSKSALCHLNRPNVFFKFFVLIRRSFSVCRHSTLSTLSLLLALPILLTFFSLFATNLQEPSVNSPRSAAALITVTMLCVSFAASNQVAYRAEKIAALTYQESSRDMYHSVLGVLAFLVALTPFSLISVALSSVVVTWLNGISLNIASILQIFAVLWIFHLYFIVTTVGLSFLIRSPDVIVSAVNALNLLCFIVSTGLIKSFRTFHSLSEWIVYLTYGTIHRYVSTYLSFTLIPETVTDCTRDEVRPFNRIENFCRWSNGSQFLTEQFPEGIFYDAAFNFWGVHVLFGLAVLSLLIVASVPKPNNFKKIYGNK
ncbi:hypothetical protein L596_002729 [Steinernema carpocapsae]|uniref:ABC transporter domain-containing protein n=1 Tax=Steinernema carpocapsae TaxID=34508 RepID=A0A4U8UT01_STECR|nr:hypothetical protein L596_002729 [Steinernema carpocapsae]